VYRAAPRDEWEIALDFMASGKLDVKPLITHRINLSDLPQMLVTIRDKVEFTNKVLMINPLRDW
jgi:L-iditol 2-dehydrogenase